MAENEPMLDIARGDRARSAFLRAALGRLRESSADDAFRSMVDDVLAGRRSLREAATSEAFDRGIAAKVDEGARRYRDLPEDERERLAAEGTRRFAELRDASGTGAAGEHGGDPESSDGLDGPITGRPW